MFASRFEGFSLYPFSSSQSDGAASKVDVHSCYECHALVAALLAVVIDEGFDLGLKLPGKKRCIIRRSLLERRHGSPVAHDGSGPETDHNALGSHDNLFIC